MTFLESALHYAEKGFSVLPLIPGWKTPACKHGFHDATTDINSINRWWQENPKYNIGIRCGQGFKILCLDVDKKKDKNGFNWLLGKADLPNTIVQITPSGGKQFIFQMPEEALKSSADEIFKGIDIRADDGYFVAPPSVLIKRSGYDYEGSYEWVTDQGPDEITPTTIPEWLLDEIRATMPEINTDDDPIHNESLVPIINIIKTYDMKLKKLKTGILSGAHPTHGSDNGMNFRIDPNKNQWACYRHRKPNGKFVGGGSLHLIALLEGILQCEECVPKALAGDRYKRVLDIVQKKFGISIDKFNEETADDIIFHIDKLKGLEDKIKLIYELKKLAKRMAKLKEKEYLPILSYIKTNFKITQMEMKAIRLEIESAIQDCRKKTFPVEMNFDNDSFGRPLSTDKNLMEILYNDPNLKECFKKDTFANEIVVMRGDVWCVCYHHFPRPLKNDDMNQVKMYLMNKYNIEFRKKAIEECVASVAVKNNYDPLIDYLNSLKWDGMPRLETWLTDTCKVEDNIYHRWISKLTLVSAVARAYVPGTKFDHVIILAGDQSLMKSNLIETLAGEWFVVLTLNEKDRDSIQKMQGAWIIELAEGMPFKKKDLDELKMFITSRKNKERFAYKEIMETYDRRSIFIMTINPQPSGYLADPTGNRRFLPIRLEHDIDIEYIKRNRDQLFAEAIIEYKNGFRIYIDKDKDEEIIKYLKEEHSEAETKDDWEEIITRWLITKKVVLKNKSDGHIYEQFVEIPEMVSCLDIYVQVFAGDLLQYDQNKQGRRIGNALRRIGAEYKSKREGNKVFRGYWIKDLADKLAKLNEKYVETQADTIIKTQEDIGWGK